MSIRRWSAKRDANEKPIVEALRGVGAECWHVSGKGLPDLIVKFRGRFFCGEVKTETGKLRATQGAFPVWRSADEALKAIGAIQ